MEAIKKSIMDTLKNASDELIKDILCKLEESGCESVDDCSLVTEGDLCPPLKPIQCRKLLQAWKQYGERNKNETLPCLSISGDQSLPSRPTHAPRTPTTFDNDWVQKFVMPWDKLPTSLMKPLKLGKRPSTKERHGIVKVVVDEIKKFAQNANMDQTRIIARYIVAAFPNSFEDRTDAGERLGCGYYTMAKLIKTRIEYTNRGSLGVRLRQTKRKREDLATVATTNYVTQCRTATQYGCMNWQPDKFPENETKETLAAKMTGLAQLAASQGISLSTQKDVHRIDNDMCTSYIIQRQLINSDPPVAIEEIKSQWPFLFVDRWLYRHFELLVGKPPYATLRDSLAAKGDRMLKFFQTKGDAVEAQMVDQHFSETLEDSGDTRQNAVAATIMRLVMHRFKEDLESLFIVADVTAAVIDIEALDLPQNPRLIVLGHSLETAEHWMISVEQKVACIANECQTLLTGLAALMAFYFVFNLRYQPEAEATLEFMQRCFFKINPTRGSKRVAGKRVKNGKEVHVKIEPINVRVAALINQLADFEWC